MDWALGGLFFVLGLIFGSFLNVCIYRIPRKESLLWPSSHCPTCNTRIRPLDNIPLISYVFLRGRCRACGAKISPRYPAVELLTGLLFLGLYLRFGVQKEVLAFLILTSLLVVISFVDIEHRLILNVFTIPGLVAGILIAGFVLRIGWLNALLGALLGGGLLIGIALFGELLFGKESMGMGDVKMAAMIGAFLGMKGVIVSVFLGFVIAAIFSLAGMALNRLQRSSYLPFGPFIAAGTLVYLFAGEALIQWYLQAVGLR